MAEAEVKFVSEDARSDQEDNFSFRVMCIQHVKKILLLASVEFRGGYWQSKVTQTGNGMAFTEKIYVPDTREEYSNAIDVLYDLLLPHLNGTFETSCNKINGELEEARQTILKKTSKEDSEVLSTEFYPQQDQLKIEEYKFKKIRLHRKLLQELSKFLKSEHYFKNEGLEE